MKTSANEVLTLAAKAARGAGAPPGQAVEFGRAALCHLIAGRGEAALRAALEALPEGPIVVLPVALAEIAESGEEGIATGSLAAAPLVQSYLDALPYAVARESAGERLHVTLTLAAPNTVARAYRVEMSDALADHLSALAARTYVPETDASRRSGAGAGLTDND